MTKKYIKKILVIRFSSIGDIVLTTPVVRGLKKQLLAEVHYLTKKSYQKIIAPNPYVDKFFFIEKKVSEAFSQLKLEQYDAIIDLHKNIRSQQVRSALRVPYFTFDKINWQKWLMVNLKINRLPNRHIVERYMDAVLPLGVKNDGEGLDFFLEKDTYDFGLPSDYIAFAIGGAHPTKRLPTSKLISICKKINQPIVLLGGKEDRLIGEEISKAIISENVINKCGKTSIDESAAMIKGAKKIITHDTGMMHIAAAFQKEIISIWGNTIPEFGMYPFYKKGINRNLSIEVKGLSCRPCSKIGFEKCPKGHFRCMMEIDEEEIG